LQGGVADGAFVPVLVASGKKLHAVGAVHFRGEGAKCLRALARSGKEAAG